MLVHALSPEAKAFYERIGFEPSALDPMDLDDHAGRPESQPVAGASHNTVTSETLLFAVVAG